MGLLCSNVLMQKIIATDKDVLFKEDYLQPGLRADPNCVTVFLSKMEHKRLLGDATRLQQLSLFMFFERLLTACELRKFIFRKSREILIFRKAYGFS
jgi:hypothetical protein